MAPQPAVLAHQQNSPFPNINAPLVDPETGTISRPWLQLLRQMWLALEQGSTALQTPAPSISPYTFMAERDTTILVNGGAVTAVMISRDGTTWYDTGITRGPVTIGDGDQIKVEFTAAPQIVIWPL